ncbi:MAG: WG repeat-containing protein, partial [Clostridia bacterium]|nr:WG repeat-containing protein [Clostridia bacterium]
LTGEYYIVRAEGETEIYDSYGTLMMNCEGEGLIYPGLPSQLVFRAEEGYRAVDIETMEASKTYGAIRANEEYGAYLCGDLNDGAMRYGLMDEGFREILPVVYDSVSVNKDGIAAALKADGLEVYALAGDHAPVLLTTINKTDTEE